MATLDWFFLLLLALAMLQGVWRGLIREVFSLVGWVAALWLSPRWAHHFSTLLPEGAMSELVRDVLGFVLCVLAILVLVNLTSFVLSKLASRVGLGALDRTLGAAFGLVRGGLIAMLLVLVLQQTPLHRLSFWQDSLGVTIALRSHQLMAPLLPSEFGRFISSCAELLALLVSPQSTN